MSGVQAFIEVGDNIIGFETGLKRLVHVRGFRLCTSYCIVELEHPDQEILFEKMNYSKFKIRYGHGDDYSDSYEMKVLGSVNQVSFTDVSVKLVGVEPGFIALSSSPKATCYSNRAVSEVVSQVANNAGLASSIMGSKGTAEYIQPNLTDLQFIVNYLQPIAVGSGDEVPYFFTVDAGTIVFKSPILVGQPQHEYVVAPNIITSVKRFTIRNQGGVIDFLGGATHKGYGYDHITKGPIFYSDTMEGVSSSTTSRFSYESDYERVKLFPYDRKWMLEAHTRSELARSKFVVDVTTIVDGDLSLVPGQINTFALPFASGELAEYSSNYYTFSVAHTFEHDLFLTHLHLVSNAMFKNLVTI